MKYKTHDGIVLTKICDHYILVAAAEARSECPDIIEINETAAECWRWLEDGATETQLIRNIGDLYEINDLSTIEKDIKMLLSKFTDLGLISEIKE